MKNSRNYRTTRAKLVERGFNVRSWALAHGEVIFTTYSALKGMRSGVEAIRIRNRVQSCIASPCEDCSKALPH